MLLCLWMMGCALRGPVPVSPAASLVVPMTRHADAFSLEAGRWSTPGAEEDCGPGRALLLEVGRTSVRLDGGEVLRLEQGVAGPDAVERIREALAPWTDAAALRRARCGLSGNPTLGLALHPALPWATARAVLMGVGLAGVSRQALIVGGPAGAPLPEGAPPDRHVQVTATLGPAETTWSRPQVGRHEPVAGPLAAALPQLVGGGELGCAVVVGREGLPVGRIVAEMDGLAGAGAERFVLADAHAPAVPAVPVAADRAAEVRLGAGTLGALLIELPTFEVTPPDHELHAGSECSPVLYADRAP